MLQNAVLGFSVALLVLNFGTHIFVRSFFSRHAKKIFRLDVGIMVVFLGTLTVLQYMGWKDSELTAGLLPPVTPIRYFAQYSFFRIWSSHVLSFIFGALGVAALRNMDKKKEGALLREDEPWIANIAIFLSGFPGVIIFLPVFFLVFSLVSAIQTLRKGSRYRVSPYFMWFPTALCVILSVYLFFQNTSWWLLWRP